MLTELRIKNYALMEELSVRFSEGLNILTGETGAGKSIIVGALGLALGERADLNSIRTRADEAVVEGVFDLSSRPDSARTLRNLGVEPEDGLLILKRALSRSGRTRCYLNNSPVTLTTLREVGDGLLDMHGQHEHQSLLNLDKHLDFLDGFGGLEELSQEVAHLFVRYEETKEKLEQKTRRLAQLREKEELYRFQLKEIEDAKLTPGEDEELDREKLILENAETLLGTITEAYEIVSGREGSVLENLGGVENLLEKASEFDESLKAELETVSSISYQLDDLWRALLARQKTFQFEPGRLEEVRERADLLRRLKKKYGVTIEEILARRAELEEELKALEQGEESTEELRGALDEVAGELSRKAAELSELRTESASKLEARVLRELSDLGMKGVQFRVSSQREEDPHGLVELEGKRYKTTERGLDRVEFLISPNPGEDLKPFRKIASGGEISRTMLALKSILAATDSIPTLIFDEIDLGIGGRVAEAVGRKLKDISSVRQVICITHLPQIAVHATTHLEVKKVTKRGRTRTQAATLDEKQRVKEIARMVGGEKTPETAIRHAQVLLKKARAENRNG